MSATAKFDKISIKLLIPKADAATEEELTALQNEDALEGNPETAAPAEPEEKYDEVVIEDGATLTNLVVAAGNYGTVEEETIESCTVLGFTMKDLILDRGPTRVFDGVPMYRGDPNGGQYRRFVQEVVVPRDIIVEVSTGENETTSKRINVNKILSVEVGGAE